MSETSYLDGMAFKYADTFDEMWRLAAKETMLYGHSVTSRVGEACELPVPWHGGLARLDHTFLMNLARRLDAYYACGELLWYLSGEQDPTAMITYAPSYREYVGDAHGAYGRRIYSPRYQSVSEALGNPSLREEESPPWGRSQLHGVIELLKRKPDSRQAIIQLWEPSDLAHAIIGDKKDLPCTDMLQFAVRDGRLCLSVYMRSNDLWRGMPYDVFCFTCIQRLVASALGMSTGWYAHTVGSMHIYETERGRCEEAMLSSSTPHGHAWMTDPMSDVMPAVDAAIAAERAARTGGPVSWPKEVTQSSMLSDVLAVCLTKCGIKWAKNRVCSPALRQAMNWKEARSC